ncbi:MAG TPA: nitrate- and nitrite sensing domain-containing protein [Streptosporangiaceae bacterium]|nr:nitrate- and nitrite sensing domain-containing protein [Streptosporangiaceae bacterium]
MADPRLLAAGASGHVLEPMPPEASNGRGVSARSSGRLLRNWRVRSRLVLLIAIPTATAVALGGFRIVSSWQSAVAYQRVERLASLSSKITSLAFALESERDETVTYIALPAGGRASDPTGRSKTVPAQLAVVREQIKLTDPWVAQVLAGTMAIGPSYPAQVRADAQAVQAELVSLGSLRQTASDTSMQALDVIGQYTKVINVLLALDDQIDLNSGDAQLAGTVQALSRVSRIEEEYSVQRAIVMDGLTAGQFAPNMLPALNASIAQQTAYLNDFANVATAEQRQLYNNTLAGSLIDRVNSDRQNVIQYAGPHTSLSNIGLVPAEWFGDMTETIGRVRVVEQDLVGSAQARASYLQRNSIISAAVIGTAVIGVLVIALLFTVVVGRSMVRPLRRLRAGALEVAGIRLPETVRRMSETDGEINPADVEPIDVDSGDEIGEVARAFDQVHREALRLAANEAALRGNVNAMFVNLSRRSQSLVERQIRLIDELEQGEQDPERLGSLFQMDHLATRMRRNSENLLVLAGHDSSRRWNQPVPLVDVLRAAISEIEQYERVTLNVQPGIAVRGPAVNDVVHLIAELAENATSFSSADTPVSVSGHLLSSGGVLLDITDQGVGMGSEEMAHANWRLDNPPVVDVAVSRRMGLFVVARLAARHGIRVRLRPATGTGLTALVWLPDEVIVHDGVGKAAGPGRIGEQAVRPAIGQAAGPAVAASGDWADAARLAAEDQVAAARAPRFAALRPDGGSPPLGPQRVPGAGPRPGRSGATSTGPLPAVGSQPPPGYGGDAERFVAGQQPAAPADRSATGPMPVIGADQPAMPGWPPDSGPGGPAWSAEPDQADVLGGMPDAAQPEQSARSAQSVFGAPVAGTQAFGGTFRTQDYAFRSADGEVIVPPPASLGEENRLPIFEAVESDWFRRGRPTVEWQSGQDEYAPSRIWTSPADEGWRAAEAAVVPASGGLTAAGLPRRVPQANLIPGTAAEIPVPVPVRSAAATRERFASLQRGMREGRAASGTDKADGATQDVPGDG